MSSQSGNVTSKGSPAGVIKKRNRISFVCQACRKSKTKCNKLKPQCTRCSKLGIACVYDVATQKPPKVTKQKSLENILESEIDYWKKKAIELMRLKEGRTTRGKYLRASEEGYNLREPKSEGQAKDGICEKTGDDSAFWNLRININGEDPGLLFTKVMKWEVNPLSENRIIVKDKFSIVLILSVISNTSANNSSVPVLAADPGITRTLTSVRDSLLNFKDVLLKQNINSHQRRRIETFTNRLLQVPSPRLDDELKQPFRNIFLEDSCAYGSGEYSELLKSFIRDFEDLLPPYDVMQSYMSHFYANIYPCLPFLHKAMFEEVIRAIVIRDPMDSSRVKLVLGNSGFRYKMENLCLLIITLKLSYMSLLFISESEAYRKYVNMEMLENYPIGFSSILLAQRLLASENWCACPNENIVACLLYIWSYFVFSPNEGDFFLDSHIDSIAIVILKLSLAIGLHRDPLEYPQLASLRDKRLINYRRLLWLSVVSITGIESALKSTYLSPFRLMSIFGTDMDDSNALEKYMERVKKTMDTKNLFELNLHRLTFRRAQRSILYQKLNTLTMNNHRYFPLSELNNLKIKIESLVDGNLLERTDESVVQVKEGEVDVEGVGSREEDSSVLSQLSLVTCQNAIEFCSRLTDSLLFLRCSVALMIYFEDHCTQSARKRQNSTEEKYVPYYYHYFKDSVYHAVQLAVLIQEFFQGESVTQISPLTNYNVCKVVQLCSSSVLLSLLVLTTRLKLLEDDMMKRSFNLSKKSHTINEETKEHLEDVNKRKKLVGDLKSLLEISLYKTYNLASENLRFTYFPTFKMLLFFDIFMKKIKSGELWSGLYKVMEAKELDAKLKRSFGITFGFKFEDGKGKLGKILRERNYADRFSIKDWEEILVAIKQFKIADGSNESMTTQLKINGQASSISPQQAGNMIPSQQGSNETKLGTIPVPARSIFSVDNLVHGEDTSELAAEATAAIPNMGNPATFPTTDPTNIMSLDYSDIFLDVQGILEQLDFFFNNE